MRILVTVVLVYWFYLIDRLMTDGQEVICLDNFYTGNKQHFDGASST